MKIAVVTNRDMINYGNRLQNYALQVFLESQDLNCETISVRSYRRIIVEYIKKILKNVTGNIVYRKRPYLKREKSFEEFNKKYIKEKRIITPFGRFNRKISKKYDFFICGSDQIWNPCFRQFEKQETVMHNFLLAFVEPKKRIAFAPSFGINKLPNQWDVFFEKELSKFKRISVREQSGASIIKHLIGKEVDTLLDPTLMLNKEEWEMIIETPRYQMKKPYLMKFVLGGESTEFKEKIKEIGDNEQLEICDFLNDSKFSNCSPTQFLYLLNKAEIICTDSFHASVFSIIFGKAFLVFERQDSLDMNSRLSTLLESLELTEHKNINGNDLFNNDYYGAKQIIDVKRKEAIEYLKQSLGI